MPNTKIEKYLTLDSDENVVKVIRQSNWRLFTVILPALTLLLLSFFFMFPLFYWGRNGYILFTVLLILALTTFSKNFFTWASTILIVTNKRIVDIDQEKIFRRVVSEVNYSKIQDIFYQISGIFQSLSRCGDLTIVLNDGKTRIETKNIPRPNRVQQLIVQLRDDYLSNIAKGENLSAAELVNLVEKIKKGIGEKKFREIVDNDEGIES